MPKRETLEKETVEELRERAAKKDIEGRSSMNKEELVDALATDGGGSTTSASGNQDDPGTPGIADSGTPGTVDNSDSDATQGRAEYSGGVLEAGAADKPQASSNPADEKIAAESHDASEVRSLTDAINEGTHMRADQGGRVQQVRQIRTDQ